MKISSGSLIAAAVLALLARSAAAQTEDGPASLGVRDVAVLVEGPDRQGVVERTVTQLLKDSGATPRDAGAVHAARAFLGAAGLLDEPSMALLRERLGAGRLVVVQLKADGPKVFLLVFAADPGGVQRMFGESTVAGAAEAAAGLVGRLPAAPIVSAPVAAPSPMVAAMTPDPASTPPPLGVGPDAPRPTPAIAAPTPNVWDAANAPAAAVVPGPRPRRTPVPSRWSTRPRGPFIAVNLVGGVKALTGSAYSTSRHGEFGVETCFGRNRWPIAGAIDTFFSSGSGTRNGQYVSSRTSEFPLGVRIFTDGRVGRLYGGGGLSFMSASVSRGDFFDADYETDSAATTGLWAGGGAFLRLGRVLHVGASARVSFGQVELFGKTENAGGLHVGLAAGFGFGSASKPRRSALFDDR